MTLYHFTAERFLKSIKKNGLTKGVMVKSMNPPQFIMGKQWLTKNPHFEQSWAKGTGRLPYKRNEVRLTIEIPEDYQHQCKPWSQMKFLTPEVADMLSAFGDPENWYVFDGSISQHWIKAVQLLGSSK